jgi:DNA processing protein
VELRPEDRRRLVDQCRTRLNLNEIAGGATSAGAAASNGIPNRVGKEVLSTLSLDTPVLLDRLIETLPGYSSSEIIAALFELELSGLVRQLPGKSFLKVWAD